MHFRLLFYLKVLGTKETVLADQQAENKNVEKISSKTLPSTTSISDDH